MIDQTFAYLFRAFLRELLTLTPPGHSDRDVDGHVARMFRSALTIGVGVQNTCDRLILDALRNADLSIDSHDLTRQHPESGEDMYFLADDNTTILQHLPPQWINLFEGVMREQSIEYMLNYLEKIPVNLPGDMSPDWTRSLFEFEFNKDTEIIIGEEDGDLFDKRLFRETDRQRGTSFRDFVDHSLNDILKLEMTDFWRDWYQGFLDGKPLDWELQRRVALIPDEEWEKGPAHIAEIIEKIRLEFRTTVGETVYRDEGADVFRLRSATQLPPEPVQYARQRIDLALGNALRNGAANGFRETSYEADVIQTVMERYPDDGSLLAVNFYDACMSLDRNIGDVYPEDTSLVILKNALFTTVEELCALDEKAKERVQRLVKLGMPIEMLEPDRAVVREIADKISDLTDVELDRRIREASDILANSEKPPRVWRAKLTNWITTISIWMDRAKKGDRRLKWLADLVDRMRKWWPNAE